MTEAAAPRSPWSPLRHPTFRALWIATVASNVGTWLQSVGAAWLMTSLTSSAVMVALVQAATSLPMFLFSLPAGALADVVDRRKLLLTTQTWMLLAALGLSALTAAKLMSPWLLLSFTALLGLGAAFNQPAQQASTPELVPREDLPAAISLTSVGFNIARAVGPALGGLIVAAAGAKTNFLLNAASFLGVLVVLYRWKRPVETSALPAERFLGAMRTGVRFVRHSPEVIAVITRGSAFVLCASSLWALLPVVARDLGRGPLGYGLLLAALGIGAVCGALVLPRIGRGKSTDLIVGASNVVFAAAIVALGTVRSFGWLFAAMLGAGGAWLSLLSSLNVAIQTLVPSWVRGRALSVYMLFIFGGLSGGSVLWGAVADRIGVSRTLLIAGAGMVLGLLATVRIHLRSGEGLNLAPSRQWPAPRIHSLDVEPDRGPVLVTVEYRIDADRAPEFIEVMEGLRRIRLRGGALQWGLFSDAEQPGLVSEVFLVSSWIEHLRLHQRLTVADEEIRQRVRSFHLGPEPPAVRRLIGESVRGFSPV
jgi:MFS family permease